MKQFFSSRRASLLTQGYRVALVVTLLVVALIFAASSFSPAAHTSSASLARASVAISGQVNPNGPMVTVWAKANIYSDTNSVKYYGCATHPSTSCPVVGHLSAGTQVPALCQYWGQTISYAGHTNTYWMHVVSGYTTGWISSMYIIGGQRIRGIPNCNFSGSSD